jgi:hypothetical protein
MFCVTRQQPAEIGKPVEKAENLSSPRDFDFSFGPYVPALKRWAIIKEGRAAHHSRIFDVVAGIADPGLPF